MNARTVQASVQVNVRMPKALKARLVGAATDADRSLTAEIVRRLEDSLDTDRALAGPETRAEVLAIWKFVDAMFTAREQARKAGVMV